MKLTAYPLLLIPAAAVLLAGFLNGPVFGDEDIPVTMTYQVYCARCHGETGKGDGPDGATLSPKPRDFADCSVMGKIPDATIVKAIKNGGASVGVSRDMPAWGEALSDKKIDALAAFVRTFCHK
jgi:cytochrome c553